MTDFRFKLVIHYRDILPGENLHEAIEDRIKKSREYILVISQNFLQSDWCQTEMEAAYEECLTRHTGIAIIALGELPRNIENPIARIILDRFNYLQWKLNDRGKKNKEKSAQRKLFWAKLVNHLYGRPNGCFCFSFGPKSLGYREVSDYFDDDNSSNSGVYGISSD